MTKPNTMDGRTELPGIMSQLSAPAVERAKRLLFVRNVMPRPGRRDYLIVGGYLGIRAHQITN